MKTTLKPYLWPCLFLLTLGIGGGCTEFLEPDVSAAELTILSPADSLYTGQGQFTFWWEASDSAEAYRLQLFGADLSQVAGIIDTVLTDNLLELSLLEGRYIWQVRIENPASQSLYQARQLVVDLTPPTQPQLLAPLAGDTVIGLEAQLRWLSEDRPLEGARALVQDSLYVARYQESQLLAESRQLLPVGVKEASLPAEILSPVEAGQEIRWQLVSRDPAGNRSQSQVRTFFVNP